MFPLRDSNPSRRWPLMTVLLIGINIYVFYRQTGLAPEGYNRFVSDFALFPLDFTKALLQNRLEVGMLLSYMFLHGSLYHLISNMWALWLFGDNVEDRMGPLRFLGFYLVSGLISGLAHIYFNPASPVPTVGASGAIAGVMGAYLLMYPTAKIVTFIPIFFIPWFINVPALIYLVFWFVIQINSALAGQESAATAGVAWWAHIGGFVFGMIGFPFFIKSKH